MIQAGASLSTTDLRKNGVEDPQALYDLIYSGKGRMPGYGENCAPKVCSCSPLLVLASCHMMHPGMSPSSSVSSVAACCSVQDSTKTVHL